MPLIKTVELKKRTKLAKSLLADPRLLVEQFTSDGVTAAMRRGDLENPFAQLWLWAQAYGGGDLARALTEAQIAFNHAAHALKYLPLPAEWEKRLNDPKRSERGYALDALSNGTFRMTDSSYGLEGTRECVQAMLAPKKKEKVPERHPLDTRDAYLLTDGRLVHVGYQGHLAYESERLEHGVKAENVGWIKITNGSVWVLGDKKPTQKQLDKLFDWCEYHKKDYQEIIDGLKGFKTIFFNV